MPKQKMAVYHAGGPPPAPEGAEGQNKKWRYLCRRSTAGPEKGRGQHIKSGGVPEVHRRPQDGAEGPRIKSGDGPVPEVHRRPRGEARRALALQVECFHQHLVGSGDDFGGGLIPPLTDDHLGELIGQVHIGLLQRPCENFPPSTRVCPTNQR